MRRKILPKLTALTAVYALLLAGTALAAELVTSAEVDADGIAVTVVQGQTANFDIKLSATGALKCVATQENPATAQVHTSFALDGSETLTSGTFSAAQAFWAGAAVGGPNCAVTWSGAPTPYVVPASVSAAATTAPGTYNIVLSSAAGTTHVTTPSGEGGSLDDAIATTIHVKVEAATAANNPPQVATPVLTHVDACTASVSAAFTDDPDDTHTASFDWGDSTVENKGTVTSPVTGQHTYTAAGTYTVEVTVTDNHGAFDSASAAFTTKNSASGILQPINPDGSSVFKINSTIPVKITVRDCDGELVSTLAPTIGLTYLNSATASVNEEVVSTSAADSGNQMRWSSEGEQYIYNLATKGRSAGTYALTISDSTFFSPVKVNFGLRK